MPYRWIVSPVANILIPDTESAQVEQVRAPKVFEHTDPARGKRYQFSAVIHANAWALNIVMADEWGPLDADPLCISLFETQFADQEHLDQTPRTLGFTTPHLTRIKNRLSARGVDVSAFTRDTPLADLLNALARVLHPRIGDIRRTWLRPRPAGMLPFVEDAVIFQDAFTEASADTVLSSHTPTPTGTSWVLVSNITDTLSAIAATDDLRGTGAGTTRGACYKSQPDPAINDYDVQFTLNAVDTGTATRPARIHGRLTDASNWYAAKLRPTGHAVNALELVKSVADAITVLATVDQAWVATDTCMLRIRDAAKSVRVNGAEVLTNADDVLTGIGSAAVSMGKFLSTGDPGNLNTDWRFDDYIVDTVEEGGGGGFVHSRGVIVG
jgi:hypothetical protein